MDVVFLISIVNFVLIIVNTFRSVRFDGEVKDSKDKGFERIMIRR